MTAPLTPEQRADRIKGLAARFGGLAPPGPDATIELLRKIYEETDALLALLADAEQRAKKAEHVCTILTIDPSYIAEIEAKAARAAELETALAKYGDHKRSCAVMQIPALGREGLGVACDCDFAAVQGDARRRSDAPPKELP